MIAFDDDSIARGAKFSCHIDRQTAQHDGVLRDEQGEIRWTYGVRTGGQGRSWRNPFNKMDFVVTNARTAEEVVIRRASFVPPRFTILGNQRPIGTVCLVSILGNEYRIDIQGRPEPWIFRMPLFRLRFWGAARERADFWVSVGPSKMDWSILIKPGIDEQPLLAALSFIHTKWWNYG